MLLSFLLLEHHFCFGRKTFMTSGSVSINGPSIRSIQYGIAGNTASRHSSMALGFPGRLTISVFPRTPAVWRERIAVGTYCKLTCRICSPKPGSIFLHTASVASGVTSLKAGPVPPVVTIRQQDLLSAISFISFSNRSCSSGITAYSASQGLVSHKFIKRLTSFPGISSYSPRLARSETLIIPILTFSNSEQFSV